MSTEGGEDREREKERKKERERRKREMERDGAHQPPHMHTAAGALAQTNEWLSDLSTGHMFTQPCQIPPQSQRGA